MKTYTFLILLTIFSACTNSNKSKVEQVVKKEDSVDYVVTGNTKIWQTLNKGSKDQYDIHLREIILKNKTNRFVDIPINWYISFPGEISYEDTTLKKRMLGGCISEDYYFSEDKNREGWGASTCCGFGTTRHIMKPNSEEVFYFLPFNPKELKTRGDSLIYKVIYYFDSMGSNKYGILKKNFYTDENKLIEIDHFISLDNIYKVHKTVR